MKSLGSATALASFSKLVVLLVLLVSSLATALATRVLAAPQTTGTLVLDTHPFPEMLGVVLNFGLPLGLGSIISWAWINVKAKNVEAFPLGLALVALAGVFSCTIAIWCALVDMEGQRLWSNIWWGGLFVTSATD